MRKTIYLWEKGEYPYPCAGEFLPNITAYVHDDEAVRPAVLVVPGGGYAVVSPTEGEIVAEKFFDEGYQAFVLTYTTNMFRLVPLKKQPLLDISRAVRCIRANEKMFKVREGAHRESFSLLLGEEAAKEELLWASLEKHVTADTPPAFLWQTMTDELVPVENSILYADACRRAGVSCELHLFMEGRHGMSLANRDGAKNRIGDGLYTMEQQWQTMKTLYGQNPAVLPESFVPAAKAENLSDFAAAWSRAAAEYQEQQERQADPSAALWPELAFAWLEKIFK